MSNSLLIEKLIKSGTLKTPEIIEAFKKIDRVLFVLDNFLDDAYWDYPLPILAEQTISQPTTVAFMLELLDVRSWNKVLDIWSGSGWTTALLSVLVWDFWDVIWVEIIPELVDFWANNLAKYHPKNAKIIQAGVKLWIPEEKFDRILVSAGAIRFPEELLEQLNPEWRLVIPVGNSIFLYKKDKNWVTSKEEFAGFVFVPLKKSYTCA